MSQVKVYNEVEKARILKTIIDGLKFLTINNVPSHCTDDDNAQESGH